MKFDVETRLRSTNTSLLLIVLRAGARFSAKYTRRCEKGSKEIEFFARTVCWVKANSREVLRFEILLHSESQVFGALKILLLHSYCAQTSFDNMIIFLK